MASDEGDISVLRLSSGDAAERDNTERFRETFGRAILRIDMEPMPGTPLKADLTLRSLPDLGMASGHLSPMRNRHGPDLIDNDDIVLVIIQQGLATLDQNGRRTEVRPGDVVITDNGEPATFTGHSATQVVNLRFKREHLAPYVLDLDQALRAATLPASTTLELLRFYAISVNKEGTLATIDLCRTVSRHLYDLAAVAIGANKDASEPANTRGLRAARLHAIKEEILRNISDKTLTSDDVAARHNMSARYMRVLFEADDTSFSEFVLTRRLQRAHHMLSDMHLAGRSIRSIASDCGFRDLSYFNRMFRRRYRMTPSDARAKAQKL